MRVSELAKELEISSDVILAKLRSLYLKAKDSHQEINDAVLIVLRRELKGASKTAPRTKEPSVEVKKIATKEPLKKTAKETKAVSKTKAKSVTQGRIKAE